MAHIARSEALNVAVDARGSLVLTSTATSACNDAIAIEAHTMQRILDDPADIRTLFARAMMYV